MIKNQFPSDKDIINCLLTNYAIEVIKLDFLPLGADMDASVYKAETINKTYFVKLKREHNHDTSIDILELLHKTGIQVIPPIKTNSGKSVETIDNCTLIVYPFVEGQDGFSRELSDTQWIKLGKNLRKLHEITIPSSIQKQIRVEKYSPKWREFVKSYYFNIENETETGTNKDEIALKLLNFIKTNTQIIQKLVTRAETFAQMARDQSSEFVLCHSDIHGGNVLLDEYDTIYIVDWDDPIMAPKERDLMFIGGGVANVWNKLHEEMLFYKGYGKTDINKKILAYYRHERIVEDIALYIQALLLTTTGGIDRPIMYKQFIDMFAPNGVIDIAFKTAPI